MAKERSKVKITVVKKMNRDELFGGNPPAGNIDRFTPECPRYEVGQEFILEGLSCPDNFCSWAYTDLQKGLDVLMFGGNHPWIKEKGTAVLCCSDGFRPVIFKLERMED